MGISWKNLPPRRRNGTDLLGSAFPRSRTFTRILLRRKVSPGNLTKSVSSPAFNWLSWIRIRVRFGIADSNLDPRVLKIIVEFVERFAPTFLSLLQDAGTVDNFWLNCMIFTVFFLSYEPFLLNCCCSVNEKGAVETGTVINSDGSATPLETLLSVCFGFTCCKFGSLIAHDGTSNTRHAGLVNIFVRISSYL